MRCGAASRTPRSAKVMGTVLVVDRDPRVAGVLAEMLTALGYVGIGCSRAQDALDLVGTGCVQGVLCEPDVRSADGQGLIEALRERFPAVSVGLLDEAGGQSGLRLVPGCRVELAKPARFEDVERAARILVSSRHLVAV